MPKCKLRSAVYKKAHRNTLESLKSIHSSCIDQNEKPSHNELITSEAMGNEMIGCSYSYLGPVINNSHNFNVLLTAENNANDCNSSISGSDTGSDDINSYSSYNQMPKSENLVYTESKHLIPSLAQWACKYKIPHNALNELLVILRKEHSYLPSDSRTILKTPRDLVFTDVSPGKYYHFGLSRALNILLGTLNEREYSKLTSVEITVNVDGLPISKSSNGQFYPILCNLSINPTRVEMIGLYFGLGKPKDANILLKQFIEEAIHLTNNGFLHKDTCFEFRISSFICDVPAKCFITYTKGHTGYHSCSKCYVEGLYRNNCVCFPETESLRMRNDADFRRKIDDQHHNGTSIIELLPEFDMVQDVPLDYMHLICLGVIKKLILLWLSGKPPNKLPFFKISKLSNLLVNIAEFIPLEFMRKPRSLNEIKRFKATEFRQFLFYTGPVVLKSILPRSMYVNFLCLHVSVTILSNSHLLESNLEYARSLLIFFVKTFIILYGKQNVSHNVHNLIHLCDDAQRFGILQNFSSFPFENHLQKLKRLLRKGDKPLAQIVKRIIEQTTISDDSKPEEQYSNKPIPKFLHDSGPLLNDETCIQFKQIAFHDFVLKTTEPNNCCTLHDESIVLISNFVEIEGKLYLIGREYQCRKNYFETPCHSSLLNSYEVSSLSNLKRWELSNVAFKNVRLVCADSTTVIPLLHCTYDEAKLKSQKAMKTSDLESDSNSSELIYRSRKTNRKTTLRNCPSFEEEEEDELDDNLSFPLPPTPPPNSSTSNLTQKGQDSNETPSAQHDYSNSQTSSRRTAVERLDSEQIILEFLKKILTKRNLLQAMLSDVMTEMDSLKKRCLLNTDVEEVTKSIFIEAEYLPINNQEELDEFESYLADDKNMKKSVLEISKFGGNNVYDFIFRAANKLITNQFAGANFSFLGRKSKNSFKDLHLTTLLLRAAKIIFASATDKDVELSISKWIRRCTERGKKEQALKKL